MEQATSLLVLGSTRQPLTGRMCVFLFTAVKQSLLVIIRDLLGRGLGGPLRLLLAG